ncbi:MAG: HAMP domain-containing histidine kinase [Archangiaceae bacterium]|nr:HAMP domain-containing histidine kinase [Archangiaceae bacterium]
MRVEDVQAFLRNVSDGKQLLGPKTWEVDRADLRSHFQSRLLKLSEWSGSLRHAQWANGLDDLATTLETLPPHQLLAQTQEYARAVLDAAAHGGGTGSLMEQHEASRVAQLCLSAGVLTRSYCEDLGLIARGSEALRRAGRALVTLGKVDALKWLLVLEVEQSSEPDEERISTTLLSALSEGIQQEVNSRTGDLYWPFALLPFARLTGFGVLRARFFDNAEEPYEVVIAPASLESVGVALRDGPWRAAARQALTDRASPIASFSGPSALEAAQEQVRLIAHEVRNALVPTRHHLTEVLRARAGDSERLRKAHEGVLRTLRFIDEMVITSEMVSERPSLITVRHLMDGVRLAADEPDRLRLVVAEGQLKLNVDSVRRAAAGVVLNALQIPSVKQVIFAARIEGRHAVLSVDDDGPGVAAEDRERVFDDGFTTKPGGSGFGLAFARKVIMANGGSIRCERSDLGGARFVIALPLQEPTP